ncbi:GNAT family N-acetyltransferase [Candidatus Babeliales bacterium]|nr:GNAT family N-acetyltransferase [Candidatus Babeliales bacterium]
MAIVFAMFAASGYFIWSHLYQDALKIRSFNFDKDAASVDALFHKGDNWYWMICNANSAHYSMDFFLRYQTSSQAEKKYDMVSKVATFDERVVGFLAYYPDSQRVWRLLFLIVDHDFRGQGIAKKLLKYAVEDMLHRGAIEIILYTRNNNFKAQSLYKNFGFKVLRSDSEGMHFIWHR